MIWFYCVPGLFSEYATTGDEDEILLIKHKRLTGVGCTNRVRKGETRQEIPDEAPNANTNQAIGKVTNFVVGTDLESYTEQPDFYFLANGVKEPKTKEAVLSTNLPVETYQLVKDSVAPAQLKDDAITYNIIVERMHECRNN